MGVNYISSTDYPSGQIIEFSVGSAKDGKEKELSKIYNSLNRLEDTSFGTIYSEQGNNNLWIIESDGLLVKFITPEQLDLFRIWDKKDLSISTKDFEVLSTIGGLPSSTYSIYSPCIQFPALIKTKEGETIDLCIIHFSSAPPTRIKPKRILFIDEVEQIMPSEMALSHHLRLKSMLADEIRMGFYPFSVSTTSGKLLTYNGITQFASTGEIKGSEIIEDVKFSFDGFNKVVDVPGNEITMVLGKWDERFEILYNSYTAYIQSQTPAPVIPVHNNKSWWQRLFS